MRRNGVQYREAADIEPVNWTKARVEEYAIEVADLLSLKPGEDVTKMVESLGGRIHYRDLDELVGDNGSVFVHGRFDFDILLPHFTSKTRDRFTIGHELGHYFLHSNQGKMPIVAFRSGSTRIEWEANWFAASLLMPKPRFEKAIQSKSLLEVAFQFGVSLEAAQVRKDALGI